MYEKIIEKRNIWQEKEAERINKLLKQKEVKKLWEAIGKMVKKTDF
jgi:gentisate 1,2-dioxygenase